MKRRIVRHRRWAMVGLALACVAGGGGSVLSQEPDLTVERLQVTGNEPFQAGVDIGTRVSLTLSNAGDADVVLSSSVRFFISEDPAITSDDVALVNGGASLQGLAAGEEAVIRLPSTARIPSEFPAGTAYLGVIVDELDVVPESDEENNTGAVEIEVISENQAPRPEITEVTPLSGKAGDQVTVRGEHFPSEPDSVSVVLRRDAQLTGLDVIEATDGQVTVSLPSMPDGAIGSEHFLELNVGVGARNQIGEEISGIEVAEPAWVWSGKEINAATSDEAFVPQATSGGATAFHGTAAEEGVLAVEIDDGWGVGSVVDIRARIDLQAARIDTSIMQAKFTLAGSRLVCARKLCELLEEAFASHPSRPVEIDCEVETLEESVRILARAGGEGGRIERGGIHIHVREEGERVHPDLTVNRFGLSQDDGLKPGSVIGGGTHLQIGNVGRIGIVSDFSVGVYLSEDAEITPDDRLLRNGREQFTRLRAGRFRSIGVFDGLQIPADYPVGPAYLGVLLDDEEVISESDEANNSAALPVSIRPTSGGERIDLEIERNGDGSLQIQWSGEGRLERAERISGPWTGVEDPGAPFTVEGDATQRYFRAIEEEETVGELPIYHVTRKVPSESALATLAEELGLPEEASVSTDGYRYTDLDRFQVVPTEEGEEMLGTDEDGREHLQVTRFLFDAVGDMELAGEEAALGLSESALEAAEMTPSPPFRYTVQARHSQFQAVSRDGNLRVNARIDTQASYQFKLGEHRVVGRGAQIKLVFDDEGAVSHLRYALPRLEEGEMVPVMPRSEAIRRAREQYRGWRGMSSDALSLNAELVYRIPSLANHKVEAVYPHYAISGTYQPEGTEETIRLRRFLVPAMAEEARDRVPDVEVEVFSRGHHVIARASVEGGEPPYEYNWASSSGAIAPVSRPIIGYTVEQGLYREPSDHVTLVVTDANGLRAYAGASVGLPEVGMSQGRNLGSSDGLQAGTEWSGGAVRGIAEAPANARGFAAGLQQDGEGEVAFKWGGLNARSSDFQETQQGGDDAQWMDGVDLGFFAGEGNQNGWLLASESQDRFLSSGEMVYGNSDLEWLAVATSDLLEPGLRPDRWWQRWGGSFGGLHLLCGYQTATYESSVEGEQWTEKLIDRLPVRKAWMLAAMEAQGPRQVVAVMGVYGPNGVTHWHDVYGKNGRVGPDIQQNVEGYWLLTSPAN